MLRNTPTFNATEYDLSRLLPLIAPTAASVSELIIDIALVSGASDVVALTFTPPITATTFASALIVAVTLFS